MVLAAPGPLLSPPPSSSPPKTPQFDSRLARGRTQFDSRLARGRTPAARFCRNIELKHRMAGLVNQTTDRSRAYHTRISHARTSVVGARFSAEEYRPTAINETHLLAKMEPGFATSICALRQLCQSLNPSVPMSEVGSNVPPEKERSLWLDLHICVQQGMTAQWTRRVKSNYIFAHIKGHENVVASVAHLADGLEDSEDVCGAGLIGPPEAVFRTALTTHPWIFNLLKGNWIKVLTEAKRDGMDGGSYGPQCPVPWVALLQVQWNSRLCPSNEAWCSRAAPLPVPGLWTLPWGGGGERALS
jgi:hypothetical protein